MGCRSAGPWLAGTHQTEFPAAREVTHVP
jgi:hypothetical protein